MGSPQGTGAQHGLSPQMTGSVIYQLCTFSTVFILLNSGFFNWKWISKNTELIGLARGLNTHHSLNMMLWGRGEGFRCKGAFLRSSTEEAQVADSGCAGGRGTADERLMSARTTGRGERRGRTARSFAPFYFWG